MCGFISGLFCSIDVYICFCANNHAVLITVALYSCLKSERVMLLAFFFPLRIVLAILGICDSILILRLFLQVV